MAEFLTTQGTAYKLEQIIINASSNLTLVTPYLQLSRNFIARLKDADQRGVHLTLIYGKDELKKEQRETIDSLVNTSIFFCQHLHAKCYCNEKELIISSMNLYEYSEKNNREMSIMVGKDTDAQIYADALREIESIKNASLLEKKKGETDESNDEEIKIDPNYNELWNFHIPYLFEMLKEEFPNYGFYLDEKIISNNFPISGMEIEIDGRVDLCYEERFEEYVMNNLKSTLSEQTPASQIYFNTRVINLYPSGGYEITKKHMIERSDELFEIIKHLYKAISSN